MNTNLRAALIAGWLVVAGCTNPGPEESPPADWNRLTQFYGMLPVFVEDAVDLGLTVNGLWGGYFTESPFRQGGDQMYPSDSAQLDAFRAANLKSPACFDSSSTFDLQIEEFPELAEAIEVKADGQPAIYAFPGGRSHFMCIHHPAWIDWQIKTAKYVVDQGGDMLTLDNLVPFVRGVQLCEGRPGDMPGFHPLTLDAFRAYGEDHPELAGLSDDEIRAQLFDSCAYAWAATTEKPPLLDVFWEFMTSSNREHLARLAGEVREYARQKGKHLVINANTHPKQVYLGAGGDLLVDFAAFWPSFDMFAHEFAYDAGDMTPMPRQKLAALYKHAWAIKGAPSSFNHLSAGELLLQNFHKGKLANFYRIQLAEAYAHRQALTIHVFPGDLTALAFFKQMRPLVDFIKTNHRLYDEVRKVHADVGLLHTQVSRWSTFSGVAQALAESNIQFEAITSFAAKPLEAEELGKYPKLLLVGAQDCLTAELQALNQYVASGGRLVVIGAEASDVPGLDPGERIVFVADDLGTEYLEGYQDAIRRLIRDTVMEDDLPRVSLDLDDRAVTAVAYRGKQEMVIHLINFDHDMATDTVRQKANLTLSLDLDGASCAGIAMLTPQAQARALVGQMNDGRLEIVVPELDFYSVIRLELSGGNQGSSVRSTTNVE